MPELLDIVRRAAVLPGVRRLTTVTPVIRATGALRGVLVRESGRFALNELRPRHVTTRYTLRGRGGRQVVVRHHTSDVIELDMAFSGGEFEPPPEAAAVLGELVDPRAVDLGANIGLFSIWLLDCHPNARIVSYEPDPGNAAVLERTIEINGLGDRWTLRRAAAAISDGMLSFMAGHGTTSRVVDRMDPDGDGVITVEARDPFADLADADVVKVDIEGGEWTLVADSRFARLPARVVCVEYHLRGAPSDDPGADAVRMVRAGGWTVHHELRPNMPGHGMVWGWRPPGASPEAGSAAPTDQAAASARA
jgi:FkbM family methyltransferase